MTTDAGTQRYLDMMAGRLVEPLEPPAGQADQQQAGQQQAGQGDAVRPAGETSPGLGSLPPEVAGPLAAALGRALAEQQLVFAATGMLNAPNDVTRYLRPEDYADASGRPDVDGIRAAVAELVGSRPHLAAAQQRRQAERSSGQGGRGGGPSTLQTNVAAVLAQMQRGERL